MLGMLAHPQQRFPRFAIPSITRLFSSLIVFCLSNRAAAQVLFNGQIFTQGLAIVDSPALNTQVQAGGSLVIGVHVAGDGRLAEAGQTPGSALPTRFEELQIYLISYSTGTNLTVSTGTRLLNQESGSTVKHLSWIVPSCTPPGSYNLTLYENSVLNNQPYSSITPIPVMVTGSTSGGCLRLWTNQLLSFPQSSSPPPQNPWLCCSTGSSSNYTAVAGTTCSGVTPTFSGAPTGSGLYPGGGITITVALPTTLTEVVTETEVLTETLSGQATTSTVTASLTSLVTMTPSASGDYVGYIPVSGAQGIFPSVWANTLLFCIYLVGLTMP